MGREHVVHAAEQFTENAFGIAEGVMGLFDGSDPKSDSGSTMEIARWLGWPILLVVPCRNAGRSITAAINGFISEAGGESTFCRNYPQSGQQSKSCGISAESLFYLRNSCFGHTVRNSGSRLAGAAFGFTARSRAKTCGC